MEKRFLYVSTSKYKNLAHECLVMTKEFLTTYEWALTHNLKEAQVVVDINEDHFFVEIFNEKFGRYNVKENEVRYVVKRRLYTCLKGFTGSVLPWGVLQGIRPTKLVYKLYRDLCRDHGKCLEDLEDEIIVRLMNDYFLSKDMASLAYEVALNEKDYIPKDAVEGANTFSVYISIPFCPTRCHYCSFPSNPLTQWEDRLDDYIDGLIKEMQGILPKLAKKKKVSTLYIGGGTPTSLNHLQLKRLLEEIYKIIPRDDFKEITVEAGRPDTITKEKLQVLKNGQVDRISINPQTLNSCTLDIIGRRHSVKDVKNAMKIANEVGIGRVNMDIILGLPNETIVDVEDTINGLLEMEPEEITIHTLAIKRSSKIHEDFNKYNLPDMKETNEMLQLSRDKVVNLKGYKPYYLYRQKNMVGSFENVGYYKSQQPCIYNIEIMEEVVSIIAFGAGGITKILDDQGSLTRVENVKNASIYLERVDDMIDRKTKYLD